MLTNQFRLTVEVVDLVDEGGRLLGTLRVNGVHHHLCLIRVREVGVAHDERWQPELDQVYVLAEHTDVQTVRVPGYEGDYVCSLHPYQA